MRNNAERLNDILEAIAHIERYTSKGREEYDSDELIRVWVIHHLGIIGEAAAALSDSLRQTHSELPWSQMIGMRNILIHQYFGISLKEVWNTVENDLPDLKTRVEVILQELESAADSEPEERA